MTTSRTDPPSSLGSAAPFEVLLADDARDLQALIAMWLTEAGYVVTGAFNGHEVVRLVQGQRFDLVVTDVLMPDGDGWDAIAEVHRLRPETPIIAMSGGAREMPASAVLRVAQGAGAIAVLKKPFTRVDLLEVVARLLAPRRSK